MSDEREKLWVDQDIKGDISYYSRLKQRDNSLLFHQVLFTDYSAKRFKRDLMVLCGHQKCELHFECVTHMMTIFLKKASGLFH